MTPKVNAKLIVEHVGIPADDAEYPAFSRDVRLQLAVYAERQEVFDGRPSVRLRQLQGLREALRKTDRGARFLIEGMVTDSDGIPQPEIDFSDIEARIDEAIQGLRLEMRDSNARQRSTETARDFTAFELAGLFKHHYRLSPKEYRFHLDAFLRGLFHPNRIAYATRG